MWRWLRPLRSAWAPRVLGGRRAERLAAEHLTAHGYHLVERNVRLPVGEIDVVARDGQTLCFVEVRSAGSRQWGTPLASIADRKRKRLVRAAHWYLRYCPVRAIETRFDAVTIEWREGGPPDVRIVRGAFIGETAADA